MDVTKIPFNHFIGLKVSAKSGYLLMLDNRPELVMQSVFEWFVTQRFLLIK